MNAGLGMPRPRCIFVAILAAALAGGVAGASAQSLSAVPGAVLRSLPSPPSIGGIVIGSPLVYTASPSIAVLPTGEYVVTDNSFGGESGASISGTTRVFRSTDKGATWTVTGTLSGMKRGSLFVSGTSLYLMGFLTDNGNSSTYPADAVIRRSNDGGRTWTSPTSSSTGLLGNGGGGTPHAPVEYGGRLWIAQGGKRVRSIVVGADPLVRANWTRSDNAFTDDGPFYTPDLVISEAQIMAAPHTGVVLMPKVQRLNTGVLLRPSANPAVMAPVTDDDWISLPGGEKKFGVRYDPTSGLFVALTNPVLPAHLGYLPNQPELVRNTAAMFTSRDLKTWDTRQIFLYSANIAYEAFQYLQFDYDGDDLVVASRTAFDIGGNKPPRGHDSNLTTFHRIADFRTAAPRHVAVISGGGVLRQELTQHTPAPLGSFVQGTSFAGAPLANPVGLGQAADGSVYVAEQAGRILRFDALGNFIETVTAAPVSLTSGSLSLAQPAAGERTWVAAGGGDWFDLNNWHYWNRPDANHEIVTLGSAITADRTLTIDRPFTMKGIRIRSDFGYSLSGTGSLVLDADTGSALLQAERGRHSVGVPVSLVDDLDIVANAAAELRMDGVLALGGRALRVSGSGAAVFAGGIAGNGSVAISGGVLATLPAGAAAAHGGLTSIVGGGLNLEGRITGTGGVTVGSAGLLAGTGTVAGSVIFGRGSTLSPGRMDGGAWGANSLADAGSIGVATAVVPEPSGLLLAAIGAAIALGFRRRSGRRVLHE
jgi:hypothetical protein